jgi:nucleoside-diphosphate-sugar epimerase
VPGVAWHDGDLLGGAGVDLVRRLHPTHLLHLAWYAVPGSYWTASENFHWVSASIDLIDAFAAAGGRRVVVAGTCAEYDWSYGYCVEGVTLLHPATPYGVCKNALRGLLESYAGQSGLSWAWGRLFLLYGPHEHPKRLVPSVIRSLLAGEPALCSHGRQIRDILHVGDVADALVHMLSGEIAGPVNIGSGGPVALRDIVGTIGDLLGRRELIQLGAIPAPAGDPPLLLPSTTRLFEEAGWSPEHSLEEGLADTIAWWREQPVR